MSRHALIKTATGLMVNAIEFDPTSDWAPPVGTSHFATEKGNPGDRWDGATFISQPLPPPDPQIAIDIQTLRDFQMLATPTGAQIVLAVKAQTRLLRRVANELS